MTSDLILSRLRRLIMLDTTVFPEVRDDRGFTLVAAGLAAGEDLLDYVEGVKALTRTELGCAALAPSPLSIILRFP